MEEEISGTVKNSKSVENVLRPMSYVTWLMGVGIARPGDWLISTIIIRLIHLGLCTAVMVYGVLDFFIIFKIFRNNMYRIMYFTNKSVLFLTSYYYVFIGLQHYKAWPKLMNKLIALDRKFSRDIPINNQAVRIKQYVALLVIIIIGPVGLIAHVIYYILTSPDNLLPSDGLLYYSYAQSLAMTFSFNILVFVVYQRLKLVNSLIKQMTDVYTASWIVMKLQRLRVLHHGVCDLVTMINNTHGIHLIFASVNCFLMVVTTLFRIYIGLVDNNNSFIMINNVIWLMYVGQFAFICTMCTLATRESGKTGSLIHQMVLNHKPVLKKRLYSYNGGNRQSVQSLSDSSNYERVCVENEVMHFSAQLQQHQIAMSACEFFDMNNGMLQAFIGGVTTYLIILIQMYDANKTMTGNKVVSTIENVTEYEMSTEL